MAGSCKNEMERGGDMSATKKARLSVLGELFGRLLSLDQLRKEQICCANPGLSRK